MDRDAIVDLIKRYLATLSNDRFQNETQAVRAFTDAAKCLRKALAQTPGTLVQYEGRFYGTAWHKGHTLVIFDAVVDLSAPEFSAPPSSTGDGGAS